MDNFILRLARNYNGRLKTIKNGTINNIAEFPDEEAIGRARCGNIKPQYFTLYDKIGLIQDGHNRPILYHIPRHKNNNKIPMGEIQENELVYSRDIPERDKNDFYRITKKYWWFGPEDKYFRELAAREIIQKELNKNNPNRRGNRYTRNNFRPP